MLTEKGGYVKRAELGLEENNLVAGFTETFAHDVIPLLKADYEIVTLEEEKEVAIPNTDLVLQLRLDGLLRHKESGQLEIIDFKSTKSLGYVTESKYRFTLQTALYTWAVEELYKEPCRGITYVVFEKGVVRYDKSLDRKIRYSPYLYGFKSSHGAYQASYAKGWSRFPVWEEFETANWVLNIMTDEERKKTWMVLPQLTLTPYERNELILHALLKEQEFSTKPVDHLIKNHQACYQFGDMYACPYMDLCWKQGTTDNLVAREDHHK